MNIEDLVGEYSIRGINQDAENTPYKGVLKLALNAHNKIEASWQIGSDQSQVGVGFFQDNILVINFQYVGDDETVYKGVVVYRCLNRNILKGFWSEKYGDQSTLGEEDCARINRFDDIHAN